MNHHFCIWIDPVDRFLRGFGLRSAHIWSCVQNLALQIRKIDRVEIENAEAANARGRQIHRDRRAQASRPNTENTCAANLLLPGQAHLRQDQMPREPPNLLITQLHINKRQKVL